MDNVLEFKPRKYTFAVTVCDSKQNYLKYEAESITRPNVTFEERQVLWCDETIFVTGPPRWDPITIQGDSKIGNAIRYGELPVRVTFEATPRTDEWWELDDVYVSADSDIDNGNITLYFDSCTRHEYG